MASPALSDPAKSIRRATMVAKGIGSDIGHVSSSTPKDAGIIRQALSTLRHYARGGFANGGYNNTLDEVLGTNTPTWDQIFGYKYPAVKPVAPWPPVSTSSSASSSSFLRDERPSGCRLKRQFADFGRNVYFISRLWPRHRSASWRSMGFVEEVL